MNFVFEALAETSEDAKIKTCSLLSAGSTGKDHISIDSAFVVDFGLSRFSQWLLLQMPTMPWEGQMADKSLTKEPGSRFSFWVTTWFCTKIHCEPPDEP